MVATATRPSSPRMRHTEQTQNGGCVQTFPRALDDGLLDIRALRSEIEQAQAMSRERALGPRLRGEWRDYGDLLETALDKRLELMHRTAESHERAICGKATDLCRKYTRHDPSFRELCPGRAPG